MYFLRGWLYVHAGKPSIELAKERTGIANDCARDRVLDLCHGGFLPLLSFRRVDVLPLFMEELDKILETMSLEIVWSSSGVVHEVKGDEPNKLDKVWKLELVVHLGRNLYLVRL